MRLRYIAPCVAIVLGMMCAAPSASAQTPPTALIRGPYLQQSTPTSLIVRWRDGTSTAGRVWYGLAPTALTSFADATIGGTLGIEQTALLTGLQPNTRYY